MGSTLLLNLLSGRFMEQHCLGIIESLRLEKPSKIIKPNCHPNTSKPAKPYPEVPHLHIFFERLQGW